uniref:Uncharacterized protein n=1 Tax=Methylophaga nitratireducenticrescens TaxID=754476 RepID=I1XEW1_METNJ
MKDQQILVFHFVQQNRNNALPVFNKSHLQQRNAENSPVHYV